MMLLAIDSSTRSVGISIFDGYRFLCEESWISQRYHTVELAHAVNTNLVRAGLTPKDLDALGVAVGPGSFTGLRIGLALIKGLAYTQQLPVIGVPTLDITVSAIPLEEHLLAAVLQAGRNRLAVGWYKQKEDRWTRFGDYENLSVSELIAKIDQPCLITGEIPVDFHREVEGNDLISTASPTLSVRSPKYLATLAWERWKNGDSDEILSLSPYYLHKGDPIPE
jgi:tRNA threonylcarbamoyladenosine biosynthesis protein TsaB